MTPGTAAAAIPLAAPVQFTGTIGAGGGEVRHEFDGAAGQFVYVVAGPTCSPGLSYEVRGPSDELVSQFAESVCNDRGRFVLPADGRYTVVVGSAGATGAYDLTVHPVRPDRVVPAVVGSPISGTIDEIGAQDRHTLDLHQGDLLYVDGIGACGGTTTIIYDLVDPAGSTRIGFARDACQDGGRAEIVADGPHELVVSGYGRGTGAYSVLLTSIRPDGGAVLTSGALAEEPSTSPVRSTAGRSTRPPARPSRSRPKLAASTA